MTGELQGRDRTVTVDGAELRVEGFGAGDETIVLSPAMFTGRAMFDAAVAALSDSYRCITYDHRGQGDSSGGPARSPADRSGIEGPYLDAVALLDRLDVGEFHWVGASLGGFVGMRVAARRPDAVRSLVLIGPRLDPLGRPELLRDEVLGAALRAGGVLGPVGARMRARIAERVMRRLFGEDFMSDPACAPTRRIWRRRIVAGLAPGAVPMMREVFHFSGNPPEMLARIQAPTLVLVGACDPDIDGAQRVDEAIPDSRLVTIPHAGHIVLVEQPDLATRAIAEFLAEVT